MCCPDCFADEFMHDFIFRNSSSRGDCAFCNSKSVPLVSPELIAPYLEAMLEAYSPKRDGKPLHELLQDDWIMFGESVDARALLSAVLGEPIASAPYVARESSIAPTADIWVKLREELQRENRFFPANAPDRELLRVLLENIATAIVPPSFYRARVMRGHEPYTREEMGAPPAELASDGRANPIGIRYLYLADNVDTAIAEVKPSKGALITVAELRLHEGRRLKLVDLTNPRGTISPFRVTQSITDVRGSLSFLQILGEELSVPTQPHRATRDYLASQYLCELIKVSGYDGVIYKSSLGDGRNIALFDVEACEIFGECSVRRVSEILVTSEIVE